MTVDSRPLDEPYIFENTPIGERSFGPVTVPRDRLWVMGDHRSASADSKAHLGDKYNGTIAVDDVIGKAAVIVWPLNRLGLLAAPAIQGTEAAGAAVDPADPPAPVAAAVLLAPGVLALAGAVPAAVRRRRR